MDSNYAFNFLFMSKESWLTKIWRIYRDLRFRKYGKMSVQEVFSQIYQKNMWGGKEGEFFSGNGTADLHNIEYIKIIKQFILINNIQSIVEIGSGDFGIMKQLLSELPTVRYTGLDIVPELVERNNNLFKSSLISFKHANAITDPIPSGDLIIIRQVLQHLQNDQIQIILNKVAFFKYGLITEHVPIANDVNPNLDKVVGPHIRSRINSGVFIDKPPFSVPDTAIIYEYRSDEKLSKKIVPAVIRTYSIKR